MTPSSPLQVLSPPKVSLWLWLILRGMHFVFWVGGVEHVSYWELALGSAFGWWYALKEK